MPLQLCWILIMLSRLSKAALAIALTLVGVTLLAGTASAPKHPFKFEQIAKLEDRQILLDRKSVVIETDKDGDTLVTGMMQIILQQPNAHSGIMYINRIQAVCGFDGVIMYMSVGFDKDGKVIQSTSEPVAVLDKKVATDPVSIAYKTLCALAGNPTPGYKSQRSNNLLWV